MTFYDSHNHLHDDRLKRHLPGVLKAIAAQPIGKMVVNGACENDWPDLLALARSCPQVIPSFGYHPWYVGERTPQWQEKWTALLAQIPAGVGEIGFDKWIKGHDVAAQTEVFLWQWRQAVERNLPVSVHCIQAWGLLLDTLRRERRPAVGFMLHSFGGPAEMIPELVKLGAYFSLPGYFAHERKLRQREAFRRVPLDRLLIETDAPDQPLPAARVRFPLADDLNHPANIGAVYEFASEWLDVPLEKLSAQVEENFMRLFGALCGAR
ncbi:MAG TPA: TatD family hydrolase [Verrucomicrobiae bacterium]|jgi:TatD DNase family protein|nr:TatD family hydrolase [Verrucomicrobiae bacterium]